MELALKARAANQAIVVRCAVEHSTIHRYWRMWSSIASLPPWAASGPSPWPSIRLQLAPDTAQPLPVTRRLEILVQRQSPPSLMLVSASPVLSPVTTVEK